MFEKSLNDTNDLIYKKIGEKNFCKKENKKEEKLIQFRKNLNIKKY